MCRKGAGVTTTVKCKILLHTSELGITLRGLRKVHTLLRDKFGGEFEAMTTNDVVEKWVKKVTKRDHCRLVEMEDLVDPRDVRHPQYFVSHACRLRCCRWVARVGSTRTHESAGGDKAADGSTRRRQRGSYHWCWRELRAQQGGAQG